MALDGSGNIYIADGYDLAIRKVTASTGYISTIAGNGTGGYTGDGGPATSARIYATYMTVDASGNIYIGDGVNSVVREVLASTGYIYTVAGGGTVCVGALDVAGDGCLATEATLGQPLGLATDSYGNLYIADAGWQVVRMVSASSGIISCVAGTFNSFGYSGDGGPATSAKMNSPST